VRIDPHQGGGNKLGRRPGEEEAEGEAGGELHHAADEDQAEDGPLAGTEGHANADLLRPLADREGDDAVDPHRGEKQGAGPEDGEQRAEQVGEEAGLREHLLHREDEVERQVAVELGDHAAQGLQEGQRSALTGAHDDVYADRAGLGERYVEPLGAGRIAASEPRHLSIGHHADDGAPGLLRSTGLRRGQADLPAQGVLSRPRLPGEAAVDDDHRLAGGLVQGGEVAPGEEVDPEGLEVAKADLGEMGQRLVLLRGVALARHLVAGDSRAAPRQEVPGGGGDDTRVLAQTGRQLVEEGAAGRLVRIGGLEEGDARGEQAAGVDPEVHGLGADDAVDHQAGAHQEEAGEGHFADHDDAGEQAEPQAGAAAPFVLEHLGDVGAGGLERRHQAGDDGGEQGGAECEGEGCRIDGDVEPERRIGLHDGGVEQTDRLMGEEDAEDRAAQGEEEALGEELPDDAAARRSER
jgi:hypothetical protein